MESNANFMTEDQNAYIDAKVHQLWHNKEEAKHLLRGLMPSAMAQEAWSRSIKEQGESAGAEKAGALVTEHVEQYYKQTEDAIEAEGHPRAEAQKLTVALLREFGIRHEVISLDREQARTLENRGQAPGVEGLEPEAEREGRTLKVVVTVYEGGTSNTLGKSPRTTHGWRRSQGGRLKS